MKKTYLVLFAMLLGFLSNAQVPTNQDCLGAIPVCQNIYSQPNAFSGQGNFPDEINTSYSCLNQGEKNDVWYLISIQNAGQLNFTIYVNNPNDDYDWALYNITNTTCADIYTNPLLEVSCNYSGVYGNTGMNGLPGVQNNPTIAVLSGQTYVLNVSNFTSSQFGYTLNFTASTAVIVNTTPPLMQSVFPLSCPGDSISVTFSKNILCSSVQTSDFLIKDSAGNIFPASTVSSPECISGSDYSKTYTLYFSPAISGNGNLSFMLVDTVLDVCSNVGVFPDTLNISGVTATVTAAVSAICIGDSVLLSGISNPAYIYQWQLFGLDIPLATDSFYYAVAGGDYTLVVITPSCGSVTSAPVTLTVDTLPIASITPAGSVFFCSGDSVVLNGNTGIGYSYQWQKNGIDINGATTADFVAYAPGAYNMNVMNICGTISSNIINVTVYPVPDTAITISGVTDICQGDSVLLSAPFDSSYSYQWSINGSMSLADTLHYIYASQAGAYTVEVTSNAGCGIKNSSPVTITISNLPLFTLQNTTVVCDGDSVLLDATSLSPSLNFQWWKDGLPISGANGQTLFVTDSGSYSVQYWNSCDTLFSNSVTVTFNSLPPIPLIIRSYDTLTCTAIAAAYQWYLNGTIISGANSTAYIATQNGSYTCQVTDGNGCTNISPTLVFNSVGFDETNDGYIFNIIPNPAIGSVTVTFGKTIRDKVFIKIFSYTGAQIIYPELEKTSNGINELTIDLNSLSPGMYVMEIQTGGKVYHYKLIKR